ncbi:DUF1800 domain-containing protein [Sedimentitalea todarodis]|uniref:DUF1800 domain-containing protein n=1 Tax=Sedimentitalea todarodis TaxID=1631240 RepID=A0ABU3V7Y9_9RHOB|nr:DUF1800 domain-containing protein [Sedimentitalea todarodis]MDU9002270.1 DUF1800 domain-containing protein [Sedimentitalea todarodis]
MTLSPEQASIRFGCGLSPELPPQTTADLLAGLRGQDDSAAQFPIESFSAYAQNLEAAARLRRDIKTAKKHGKTKHANAARDEISAMRKRLASQSLGWYVNTLLRWSWSEAPLRERLAMFWADHFTAMGKNPIMVPAAFPYIEEAIRPNVNGRFADLLIAAVTHPLMLHFLDQSYSVGPGSVAAERAERLGGLNENLAREVLELHTLGVDGPYNQDDVRQLAELFTGLSYKTDGTFTFREGFAEPGAETVLGVRYGVGKPGIEPVLDALRDLSVHPATARHIALKLAVHFVSDNPGPALVDHVAARFVDTDGDLQEVYAALLDHPASWTEATGNVKPPFDLIATSCRALAVTPKAMQGLEPRKVRRALLRPLAEMGQPLLKPGGPDGWAEEDAAWITPQGLSARLRWAVSAPTVLRPNLPEPSAFVDAALGPFATQSVRFAAQAAESRSDAIGLVLSSPAFQRR